MNNLLLPATEIRFNDPAAGTPWINFDFSRRSRIILPGHLDGNPLVLLLDSGAEKTIIDQSYANTLKLRRTGTTVFTDRNRVSINSLASGIRITLPGLTVTPNEVVLADLRPIGTMTGIQISAILGREIFERTVVEIDFNQTRIRFLPFDGFVPRRCAVGIPLRKFHAGHGRVIDVQLGNEGTVPLEFDLGSANPIVLQRSYWEQTNLGKGPLSNSLIGGVGGIREAHLTSLPFVQIGGWRINEVDTLLEIKLAQMEARLGNGLLGMPLISKFRVTTDFNRNMLYLGVDENANALSLSRHRSGLRLLQEDQSLRVILVARNSPAEKAGWKIGDQIASVSGHRIDEHYWRGSVAQWHELGNGTKVNLVMVDGTSRLLVLQDYY